MMAVMRRGQQQKRPQKKKCKLVDDAAEETMTSIMIL
jgi:hypothetical protein